MVGVKLLIRLDFSKFSAVALLNNHLWHLVLADDNHFEYIVFVLAMEESTTNGLDSTPSRNIGAAPTSLVLTINRCSLSRLKLKHVI